MLMLASRNKEEFTVLLYELTRAASLQGKTSRGIPFRLLLVLLSLRTLGLDYLKLGDQENRRIHTESLLKSVRKMTSKGRNLWKEVKSTAAPEELERMHQVSLEILSEAMEKERRRRSLFGNAGRAGLLQAFSRSVGKRGTVSDARNELSDSEDAAAVDVEMQPLQAEVTAEGEDGQATADIDQSLFVDYPEGFDLQSLRPGFSVHTDSAAPVEASLGHSAGVAVAVAEPVVVDMSAVPGRNRGFSILGDPVSSPELLPRDSSRNRLLASTGLAVKTPPEARQQQQYAPFITVSPLSTGGSVQPSVATNGSGGSTAAVSGRQSRQEVVHSLSEHPTSQVRTKNRDSINVSLSPCCSVFFPCRTP